MKLLIAVLALVALAGCTAMADGPQHLYEVERVSGERDTVLAGDFTFKDQVAGFYGPGGVKVAAFSGVRSVRTIKEARP